MKLIVNKKEEQFDNINTVGELLKIRNNNRAAVWVNGQQLLKSQYEDYPLNDGDKVKILRILAGG